MIVVLGNKMMVLVSIKLLFLLERILQLSLHPHVNEQLELAQKVAVQNSSTRELGELKFYFPKFSRGVSNLVVYFFLLNQSYLSIYEILKTNKVYIHFIEDQMRK